VIFGFRWLRVGLWGLWGAGGLGGGGEGGEVQGEMYMSSIFGGVFMDGPFLGGVWGIVLKFLWLNFSEKWLGWVGWLGFWV
jgi:hypothetical protein